MRRLTTVLAFGVLLTLGCGGGELPLTPTANVASPEDTLVTETPESTTNVDWTDPEPDGAQQLAERVLHAEWNNDKILPLQPPRTARLTMSITTLVASTSNLDGFSTAVEAGDVSLDQRLADLGAEESDTEVTIRLPGAILFDFDSAEIRPDAERTLREIVEVIAGFPKRPVRIEGHTDAIASEAYNQALSEDRAQAVANWLTANGVDRNWLTIVGHGEAAPVADNATAAGRQKNRRVEIVIEK